MPHLALLLRDLHPPRAPDPGEDAARLPALEYWLARADVQVLEGGWRGWLAGAALGGSGDPGGGAGLAAAALLAAPAGGHFWFATPVHYVAGMDTLHLPAAGLLRLAADEQQALAADFRRAFAGAPWQLHPTGYRDLLLEGPDIGAHETRDPAVAVGGDLASAQPRGAGVRALRQLAAEIEMWLFEHRLNRDRERRGEVPVTGLWPWGAGVVPAAAPVGGARWRLLGDDAYSAALAATSGGEALQAPPPDANALPMEAGDRCVVLSGACLAGWQDLLRLEQQWFAPLCAQLQSGRWSALTLAFGDRAYTLRRAHRWRAWRRPHAWWKEIGR